MIKHPCDVCGKEATSLARDFYRYEDASGFYEYYPVPNRPLKAGCEKHPAESEEVPTMVPPPPLPF